jgi:4,5-DOPA dioxygenase extradiol
MNESDKITPALFLSHGSPMNAILENEYTQDLKKIGEGLKSVRAILVISAHWETYGLSATASETLSTYHDFRGFPKELFEVQYPVKSALWLIPEIERLSGEPVNRDLQRGLDHGAWSMLAHLFPHKDVPVMQLSIDRNRNFAAHLELAKKLAPLREQNVLILASGNITHNFSHADFTNIDAKPLHWAVQFDELVKNAFLDKDAESLVSIRSTGDLYKLNHPSDDHFIPLLYLMGVMNEKDKVSFPHMSWQAGTMSMRHIELN